MNGSGNNENYDTLSEAINQLRNKGYQEDFNLKPHCLECSSSQLQLHPEEFTVDAFYRFEGMSNPDDSSILYAISGKDGLRGLLVDAYGMYSESLTNDMVEKLKVKTTSF